MELDTRSVLFPLVKTLFKESRSITYTIVLGTWLMLTFYAILHDQYLVRIAPEHFTEYHEPLGNIRSPYLIAFLYAIGATVGPGLLWGVAAAWMGRGGARPVMPVGLILKGVVVVILITEMVSAATGVWVWKSGRLLYPETFYPEDELPILVTQTIQITCHLASVIGCMIHLIWIHRYRKRADAER